MAKNDFAIGLLVGGALGAAIALLYAPAPGEEVRSTLGDKASDLGSTVKGKATEYGATVKDKATEYGSSIKEAATHLGSTVKEKVASVRHHDEEQATATDMTDTADDLMATPPATDEPV